MVCKSLLVSLCLTALIAHAQVDTGVLTGVVPDNGGAVIPGAKVIVRNYRVEASRFGLVDEAAGVIGGG